MSIIIPTRNEEAYLPVLLTSIRKQTAQPKEVIVADADSDDKTREIAKSFGCMVVQGGRHPGIGRNKGAAHATQPLLLFLDADAQLSSDDFLEKNVAEFQQKGLGMASCNMHLDSHSPIDHGMAFLTNSYFGILQYFLPCANGFCMFVKRDIHEKIHGFDEQIHIAEDWDYSRRAGKLGTFRFLTSRKIIASMRRFEKEGRIKLFIKYIQVFFYSSFVGKIKKDSGITYEFSDYTKKRS